jgi:hypothetical protein
MWAGRVTGALVVLALGAGVAGAASLTMSFENGTAGTLTWEQEGERNQVTAGPGTDDDPFVEAFAAYVDSLPANFATRLFEALHGSAGSQESGLIELGNGVTRTYRVTAAE